MSLLMIIFIRSHEDTGEYRECPDPPPRGLSKSMVWIMGLLIEKIVTDFGNHCLNLFSLVCLYCYCGICLQGSQKATKGTISMLVKFPADWSGHIVKEGDVWDCKSWPWGLECWGRSSRRCHCLLTCELDPGQSEAPHPFPYTWNVHSACLLHS